MPSVIDLYERLATAGDDKARAKIIAEAFEERYPRLSETATRADLSETELRLVKEIEQVRAERKETELRLVKEIEQVRADLKETELRLVKEIEQVRQETEHIRSELKETELRLVKEIEQVRADLKVEIARSHTSWLKWSFLFWLTQFSAIVLLLWRVWPRL